MLVSLMEAAGVCSMHVGCRTMLAPCRATQEKLANAIAVMQEGLVERDTEVSVYNAFPYLGQ